VSRRRDRNPEVRVHPDMPVNQLIELLQDMSTDTHEACLEAFATPTGLAATVRLVHRDDVAPDFLRMQSAAFDALGVQGGKQ
jgi:hypothetical protein